MDFHLKVHDFQDKLIHNPHFHHNYAYLNIFLFSFFFFGIIIYLYIYTNYYCVIKFYLFIDYDHYFLNYNKFTICNHLNEF